MLLKNIMSSCANRFKDECDEPCEWKLARKYGNARRKPGKCIYSGYESSYSSKGTEDCHTSKDSCRGACKWYADGSKSHGGTCVYRKHGRDATTRLCGSPYGTPFVPIAQLVQQTINRGGLPSEGEECRWIAKHLLGNSIIDTVANVAQYGRKCLTSNFTSEQAIDGLLQRLLIGIAKNLAINNLGAVAQSDKEFVEQLKTLQVKLKKSEEDKKLVEELVSGVYPVAALQKLIEVFDEDEVKLEEEVFVDDEEEVKKKKNTNSEFLPVESVFTKIKSGKHFNNYSNYKENIEKCKTDNDYWWNASEGQKRCQQNVSDMSEKWRTLISQYAKVDNKNTNVYENDCEAIDKGNGTFNITTKNCN